MLCYVMLCYVMLCYVMLCYVMLCYVMLCYVMSFCFICIFDYFLLKMENLAGFNGDEKNSYTGINGRCWHTDGLRQGKAHPFR